MIFGGDEIFYSIWLGKPQKVIFLMAWPIRVEGGVRALPLRKKLFLKLYLSYFRQKKPFATKLEGGGG